MPSWQRSAPPIAEIQAAMGDLMSRAYGTWEGQTPPPGWPGGPGYTARWAMVPQGASPGGRLPFKRAARRRLSEMGGPWTDEGGAGSGGGAWNPPSGPPLIGTPPTWTKGGERPPPPAAGSVGFWGGLPTGAPPPPAPGTPPEQRARRRRAQRAMAEMQRMASNPYLARSAYDALRASMMYGSPWEQLAYGPPGGVAQRGELEPIGPAS